MAEKKLTAEKKQVAEKKPVQAKKKKMSLHTKNSLKGLVFVSPFILGMLLFFIYPIILSIRLAFGSKVLLVGFQISGFTLDNFTRAISIDVEFLPIFAESVRNTLVQFPLIIVLSLIIAVLLNRDIKCRGLFRVIFFIPFLLGTGNVMQQLLNQGVDRAVLNIMDGKLIPYNVLSYFGTTIVDVVQTVLSVLVTVLWGCGVQILLFLSGLQSISGSLYEAARIDGATEWEIFWKVTVPMIAPMILLNMVYTVVDSLASITNPLLEYMKQKGYTEAQYAYGSAMGWMYFAFIGLLVALIFVVMKGFIHTSEVEEVKKREHKHKVFTIERAPRRTFD